MLLSLVTPPASAVVTLAEAKAHLRVEHSAEDAVIQSYIDTAEALCAGRDGWTGRALLPQTWRIDLPGFPLRSFIEFPLPPLRAVASLSYYDSGDVLRTMPADDYRVLTAATPGRLELLPRLSWPGTYTRPDAVQVQFSAGYDSAAAVPAPIKISILVMVGALYTGRGDTGPARAPMALRRMLAPYKNWAFDGV